MCRLAVCICLLLATSPAVADPVSVFLIAYKAISVGSFFTTLAVTLAVSLVSRALFKPKAPSFDFNEEVLGRTQIVRSSVAPRRVIYGKIKVSGVLVFAGSSGERNKFMHLVIVLAGHQIEAIDDVYFNDRPAADWDDKWYRVTKHLGAPDQAADPGLIGALPSHWTQDHRLRGCAYLSIRLVWDVGTESSEFTHRAWPNGIPNVTAIVRGKRVYDPRTKTTAYSNNWALCVADYLRSQDGLATPDDEIDWATVTAAANLADEDVPVGGQQQARYRCDGSYTLDSSPLQILEALRSAGAGAVFWTGGQWHIHAGGAVAATRDIDEDDLRGALTYQPHSGRSSLFNSVRGTYISPQHAWKPTDFPPVTNAIYEQQDGNERIEFDLDLAFTTDGIAAQRLAKIELERHRQSITVNLPCNLSVLGIKAWDVVRLSIGHLGWAHKLFQVVSWQLSDDLGVDLELVEYHDSIYAWDYGEARRIDPAPPTQLPDLNRVPRPLALQARSDYSIAGGGRLDFRLAVTWSISAGSYVSGYQVQYKLSSAAAWTDAGTTAGTRIAIAPIDAKQQYDVRVRAVNTLGVVSAWASVLNYYVTGKTARPSQVADFRVAQDIDYYYRTQERFSWSEVADADLAGYRIRAKIGQGHAWEDLTALHHGLLRTSPWKTTIYQLYSGVYTAAIVAVDTSGNESLPTYLQSQYNWSDNRSRLIYAVEAHRTAWRLPETSAPFVLTNLVPDKDGALISSSTLTWDDLTSWDDWIAWSGESASSALSARVISPVIDLGTVYDGLNIGIGHRSKGTKQTRLLRYYKARVEDRWQVSNRNRGAATSGSTSGTFRGLIRYVQFAAEITRDPQADYMLLLELRFSVFVAANDEEQLLDVDTSTWAGSAASGRQVPTRLSGVAQIQIVLQSVGAGWSWETISKSPPTIKIYDAQGSPADAVVDVVLRGA